MKAVILAGGNGTRLHPLSLATPKPMVKLLDKPILEHILMLLKANGFTDIGLTLRYLPGTIMDYFGDGASLGLHLQYRIEDQPLGTAGSVAACRDFIGQEDVLVISGDAACGADLKTFCAQHYENLADVSLLLKKSSSPLEFGLVLTGRDNRVQGFVEKPARDRVYTDLVNTGIYVLSNRVLQQIPSDTFYDFARDLFPKLLADGARLFGFETNGYWCDIGNKRSYLKANFDALRGDLPLELRYPMRAPGICSAAPLPDGISIKAPCCIGANVRIEPGAKIGPYAVIGSGSTVKSGAMIQNSVVDQAVIGQRSRLRGSIVCAGSCIGADAVLLEGSVVGANCQIGKGCCVDSGVCLWPGNALDDGCHAQRSIVHGGEGAGLCFGEYSTLRGEAMTVMTPELCLSLGMRIPEGRICVSASGGYPQLLAGCFASGAAASGHPVLETDSATVATAANTGRRVGAVLSAYFYQQEDDVCIRFFNADGLPLPRDVERMLESLTEHRITDAAGIGTMERMSGCNALHRADVSRFAFPNSQGRSVCVEGRSAAASLLCQCLNDCGITATRSHALPAVQISRDGMELCMRDEEGQMHSHTQLLAALTLLELEHGAGRLAVPYHAPDVVELLATQLGGTVLRLGRDATAADTFRLAPVTADGIYLAVRILTGLEHYGSLATLMQRVPRHFQRSRELQLDNRSAVLRRLATAQAQAETEFVSGLKIRTSGGSVHITPVGKQLLRIQAECGNEEYAEELCAQFAQKIETLAGHATSAD